MSVPKLTGNRAKDRASIWKYDFSDFPENLSKMTDDQREMLERFYATMSLVELRRRQRINEGQREVAFASHNDEALESLYAMENILSEAIRRSEFDDLQYIRGARLKNYENRAFGVGPVIVGGK